METSLHQKAQLEIQMNTQAILQIENGFGYCETQADFEAVCETYRAYSLTPYSITFRIADKLVFLNLSTMCLMCGSNRVNTVRRLLPMRMQPYLEQCNHDLRIHTGRN